MRADDGDEGAGVHHILIERKDQRLELITFLFVPVFHAVILSLSHYSMYSPRHSLSFPSIFPVAIENETSNELRDGALNGVSVRRRGVAKRSKGDS